MNTKINKKSQKRKFEEAAQEAGCSDDETAFDDALRKIGKAKPEQPKDKKRR